VRRLALAIVEGDGEAAAQAISLRYVNAGEPGVRRLRRGRAFTYLRADGSRVRDPATLSRIRSLAIPPAWARVWICVDPDGHVQATGFDARGRKQYRYHNRWRQIRDAAKYHRLVAFCHVLPRMRRQVARDLACRCLCKRKVVATIVSLMEKGQLRVGNDEYTRQNGSYGATTLLDRHATIRGPVIKLAYRGKSGILRRIRLVDQRLATIVRRCRDLPGQRLFQYVGDEGEPVAVLSTDVNEYLREISGGPFTAKDFRTWAATLSCALLLSPREVPKTKNGMRLCVNEVLRTVAARLGHTPAICRSSYIHPGVFESFARGELSPLARNAPEGIEIEALLAIEKQVAAILGKSARLA
jgi:DNA topoisomerase I